MFQAAPGSGRFATSGIMPVDYSNTSVQGMILDLALFAIGFSVLGALLLITGHLLTPVYAGLERARWLGILLLANLVAVQLLHYSVLKSGASLWVSPWYAGLLFLTAPLFYFYCRSIIRQDQPVRWWYLLALVPAVVGCLFPGQAMFFAAFFLGSVYFGLLAWELYGVRSQRKRFNVEMASLLFLFVVAGMTLVLGLVIPLISQSWFIALYAVLIGISFFLALTMIVRFPDIVARVEEAVQGAYASSTLKSVNRERKIEELNRLMLVDRLYTDETLSLSKLADQLELTTHQLSELLNNDMGIGFSRYIRELRVAEARRQLLEESDASVLSIGLSVGFTSQSSFYTAFREVAGMPPGQFRKVNNDG